MNRDPQSAGVSDESNSTGFSEPVVWLAFGLAVGAVYAAIVGLLVLPVWFVDKLYDRLGYDLTLTTAAALHVAIQFFAAAVLYVLLVRIERRRAIALGQWLTTHCVTGIVLFVFISGAHVFSEMAIVEMARIDRAGAPFGPITLTLGAAKWIGLPTSLFVVFVLIHRRYARASAAASVGSDSPGSASGERIGDAGRVNGDPKKRTGTGRAGKVAVAAIFGLVTTAVGVWFFYGRDIEPPDDSDFALPVIDVPVAMNGYYDVDFDSSEFPEGVDSYNWFESDDGDEDDEDEDDGDEDDEEMEARSGVLLHLIAFDANRPVASDPEFAPSAAARWNEPAARALVDESADLLAGVERAIGKKHFIVPAGIPRWSSPAGNWSDLGYLLQLRLRLHLLDGDTEGAIADGLRLVRFGERFGYASDQVNLFRGLALRDFGYGDLRRIAELAQPTPTQCAEVVGELERYEFDAERLNRVWATEYAIRKPVLDAHELSSSFFFHRNRTLERLVASFRVNRDWIANSHWTPPPYVGSDADEDDESVRNWFNWMGPRVYSLFLPYRWHGRWSHDFDLRATRLFLALRGYSLEHGALPESLDALVPAYIDSVPADPFSPDESQILYSRTERQLWSVGKDLEIEDVATNRLRLQIPEW